MIMLRRHYALFRYAFFFLRYQFFMMPLRHAAFAPLADAADATPATLSLSSPRRCFSLLMPSLSIFQLLFFATIATAMLLSLRQIH